MNLIAPDWRLLSAPSREKPADPILQLHWASQIVAAVGFTHVEPESDWSHTNMEWVEPAGLAGSRITAGPEPARAVLRFADLTLELQGGDGATIGEFPLAGKTLDDGYRWMEETLSGSSIGVISMPLFRPEHELPPHPVGSGAMFSAEGAALKEPPSLEDKGGKGRKGA